MILVLFCAFASCQPEFGREKMKSPPVFDREYYQEYLEELNGKIIRNTQDPRIYFQKAKVSMLLGDSIAALRAMDKAVELDSASLEMKQFYTGMLLRVGDVGKAVQYAEDLYESGDRSFSVLSILAQGKFEQGEDSAAFEYVGQALALRNESPNMLSLLGYLDLRKSDTLGAEQAWQRSLRSQFDDQIYHSLFDLYLSEQDSSKVMSLKNEFEGNVTDSIQKAIDDALYYQLIGKNKEALGALQSQYEKDTSNIRLLKLLSDGYLSLNFYDSAIYYAQKGIAIDSTQVDFFVIEAKSYESKFWYTSAIEFYQKALNLSPADSALIRDMDNVRRKREFVRRKKELESKEEVAPIKHINSL